MSNPYGVDSIHINVILGDGAVHLLLGLPSSRGAKPRILNAVLIDGGHNRKLTQGNWKGTLDHIKSRYANSTGGDIDYIQFDAVVVTHWDQDHWQGLSRLINGDLDDQFKRSRGTVAPTRSNYFKYDSGTGNPTTVFYCPYWAAVKTGPKSQHRSGAPKVFKRVEQTTVDYLNFGFRPSNSSGGSSSREIVVTRICLLKVFDKQPYLGTDFFTNTDLPATGPNYGGIITKEQLVRYYHNLDAQRPRMICVAANQRVIGAVATLGRVDVINEMNTMNNQVSVCAMIIWPSGRLSHYFAGDADYATEELIATWTGTTGVRSDPSRFVATMKASHHGAATSSPIQLLQSFNPRSIIIPSGTDYGHPRWELFFFIEAWCLALGDQPGQVPSYKPLYPMSYPYWFAWNNDTRQYFECERKKPKISPKAFVDDTDENRAYWQALATLYTMIRNSAAGRNLLNPCEQFVNEVAADATWQSQLSWIIGKASQTWALYSDIGTVPGDAIAAATISPTGAATLASDVLEYIRVQCRDVDGEDGDVFVKRAGNPFEKPYQPVKTVPALRASQESSTRSGKGYQRKTSAPRQSIKARVSYRQIARRKAQPRSDNDDIDEGDGDTKVTMAMGRKLDISKLEAIRHAEGLATAPLVPGASAPAANSEYYYYCSQQQRNGASAWSVSEPMDDFVTLLHNGNVGVDGQPGASASSFAVLADDEWCCWFADALGATNFKSSATTTDLLSFGFSSTVIPSLSLDFDTTSVNIAAGLDSSLITPSGLTTDYDLPGMMIFGLSDQPSPNRFTLADLFAFAGQELPNSNLIKSLSRVTLSVDVSKGSRNMVWFLPGEAYKTVMRIQSVATGVDDLVSFFSFLKGFAVITDPPPRAIAKKTATWMICPDGAHVKSTPEVCLEIDSRITTAGKDYEFSTSVVFEPDMVTVILDYSLDGALGAIVEWIVGLLPGSPNLPLMSWIDNASKCLANAQLRRLTLQLVAGDNGPFLASFSVEIQMTMAMGHSDGTEVAACHLTYSWPSGDLGRLIGSLWCSPVPATLPAVLDSAYEKYHDSTPTVPAGMTLVDTVDLTHMGSSDNPIQDLPDQIPHNVCALTFEIDSEGLYFNGALATKEPAPSKTPIIDLDRVGLDLRWTWGTSDPSVTLSLAFYLLVEPPTLTNFPSCNMDGQVDYTYANKKGSWTISGQIQDLNVATIASFFDSDSQSSAMQMMAKMDIAYLDLVYHLAGDDTSFDFTGILQLGDLELDLAYHYDKEEMQFTASLGSTEQTATPTLQQLLDSIDDDLQVPAFVGNVQIPASKAGGVISINFERSSAEGFSVFWASIEIDVIELTFVQFRHKDWDANTPAKRLIRAALRKLPDMNCPVINTLTQPFDSLDFVWVKDDTGTNAKLKASSRPGFTFDDIQNINQDLSGRTRPFSFQHLGSSTQPKPNDVVLQTGEHFMIVLQENGLPTVALDYILNSSATSQHALIRAPSAKPDLSHAAVLIVDQVQEPATPPAMGPLRKSYGPLTISNIGLQYRDGTLSVIMDAKFQLGPISFDLLGFGFGIDLTNFHFADFPTPVPQIAGLAVQFDASPVVVAGMFERKDDMFYGGISVEFAPYLFLAAGGYGTVDGFKTVFIFAELEGPIIELEFLNLSDVCGGFGYNSHLKYPSPVEVPSFPFIGGNMSGKVGNTPIDTITKISDGSWISPVKDSLWFAIGAKVDAFSVLSCDAVIAIQFNPSVTLGIFADVVASIPENPQGGFKLAYVELGISAVVDFKNGIMDIEGVLAPSSFILDPDCHLSGGFALCYWFTGSPYEGDWVFTIGGYHQAFSPPLYYPNPDRLAINWSMGALSITGQAYFAITPKVCMGGGLLQAHLGCGPLEAWFDAYADFLINYKPFHFIGEAGVDVGVRFSLDLLFVTIHISVDIGAQLYLTGPPVQGYVHVDFWVFGFDIHFGPDPQTPQAVTLEEFYRILQAQSQAQLQANPAAKATTPAATTDPAKSDHILTVQSGLITSGAGSQTSSASSIWQVRAATFVFRVESVFAIQQACISGRTDDIATVTDPVQLYSKPMHIPALADGVKPTMDNALMSSMSVKIERKDGEAAVPMWKIGKVLKNVPVALWDPYVPADDPIGGNNHVPSLLDGKNTTKPHMMAVTLSAPPATLADDMIPAFDAAAVNHDVVSEPLFPAQQDPNPAFLPVAPTEKPNPPAQPWIDVAKAWSNPAIGADMVKDFVQDWISVMGWSITDDDPLISSPPSQTIAEIDQLYMAAPLMGAAS